MAVTRHVLHHAVPRNQPYVSRVVEFRDFAMHAAATTPRLARQITARGDHGLVLLQNTIDGNAPR